MEESLVIGLLPEMNVFKQKQRFKPLAAYLSEHMGIEVKLTILSRYGNIIERIQNEEVDGAFLGSFTGALAISQLEFVPLATTYQYGRHINLLWPYICSQRTAILKQ